jgi:hypothetical protein
MPALPDGSYLYNPPWPAPVEPEIYNVLPICGNGKFICGGRLSDLKIISL